MRRRNPAETVRRPTQEQNKDLIVKNLSGELITSGLKAVDSISVRFMYLTMASKLLKGVFDSEIERLYILTKREAEEQTSDIKVFSPELIRDVKKITVDILKEFT